MKKKYVKPEMKIIPEIWKVYKEFDRPWNAKNPKHYIIEVSDFGRVKRNGEIVEPDKNRKYLGISTFYIHRAVAELFIPNPENKPCVDHIDTNTHNNRATNLQWVTYIENGNNPITLKKLSKSSKGRIFSEKHRKNISLNHWDCSGENNPMYGKPGVNTGKKRVYNEDGTYKYMKIN